MQTVTIGEHDYTLESLYADVEAAKKKELSGKWAFTPETVQALLEKISSLSSQLTDAKELLFTAADNLRALGWEEDAWPIEEFLMAIE